MSFLEPTIDEVRELLAKQPIPEMELGNGGKVVDKDGRLICTFNLRDLTLPEAFTLAKLLMVAGQASAACSGPGRHARSGQCCLSSPCP